MNASIKTIIYNIHANDGTVIGTLNEDRADGVFAAWCKLDGEGEILATRAEAINWLTAHVEGLKDDAHDADMEYWYEAEAQADIDAMRAAERHYEEGPAR